jgi:hypothetical protein
MQPYFFAYLGYFQLIAHSDIFVHYDDIQYSKGGWINRNRILWEDRTRWLTLPVRKGALHQRINQRFYQLTPKIVGQVLRRIEMAYREAPQFRAVFPLLEEIFQFEDANIAAFNVNLIERLTERIGLRTRLVRSSKLKLDDRTSGQERVIAICRRLGATQYVNAIGGIRLYDAERFAESGITLRFLKSLTAPYPQFGSAFVPSLSIIDALMFNENSTLKQLLTACRITDAVDLVQAEPSAANEA